MAVAESETYVGSAIKRKEDDALLRGGGTYVDNLTLPGTLAMIVVRSPYPHARITGVNLDAARALDGVVAAFSGADLADDWAGGMPCAWPVTEDIKMPPHYPLATDEARYQGDGVAVVVAESRAIAKDAAELVEVDYEALGAVADVEKALADGAPLVHSDLGTNECYVWKLETDDVQAAIDAADVVVTRRYFQPRLIPNAMEPRGVLAQVGPTGDVTMWSATQIPHILRFTMQLVLGIPESKTRVIAPDVGGAFGSKLDVYAEEYLAVALAKRLGRPVKWTEERAENYVATIHGRDVVHELTFAATKDGKITAVKSEARLRDGRVPPARDAGDPAARSLDLLGPVRDPELQRDLHGRLHAHDADGRVPRRRPTRGHVRPRADDGRARRRARHGPGRAPSSQLRRGVPAHDGVRAHDRLGRLPRDARPPARAARPGLDQGRPGEATQERRLEADRGRLLDLQRDVRPRSRRASSARSATPSEAGRAQPFASSRSAPCRS